MSDLQSLPNEVFENIALQLELDDVRNIRVASRELCVKATQEHFKSFFRTKHVDITRDALQRLENATQVGQLGCIVENIVLVGQVYDTKTLADYLDPPYSEYDYETTHSEASIDDEDDCRGTITTRQYGNARSMKPGHPSTVNVRKQCNEHHQQTIRILKQHQAAFDALHTSGEDAKLLARAFNNLAIHGKNKKLASIKFEVAVYRKDSEVREKPKRGGAWEPICTAAGQTLHTAISALAASQLPVSHLDICNRIERCSVEGIELSRIDFTDISVANVFSSMQSLSLSISDKVIDIFGPDTRDPEDIDDQYPFQFAEREYRETADMQAEAAAEENFAGLISMLQKCDRPQHLDMHKYSLGLVRTSGRYEIDRYAHLFTRQMTKNVRLPHLVSFRLRGFHHAEAVDLVAFLKAATSMRRLEIDHCLGDYFEPVFNYCTGHQAKLQRLMLRQLWTYDDGVILFDFPWNGSDWPPHPPHPLERVLSLPGRDDIFCSNTLDREGDAMLAPIAWRYWRGVTGEHFECASRGYERRVFGV